MNSDKQIDEMAKVIENGVNICAKKPCEDCDFCGADDCMCQNLVIAKELHTAGYRKASDVAREIIDDLESQILPSGKGLYAFPIITHEFIAELKNKYTEGEG